MKTIWKFPLDWLKAWQTVSMPKGAETLCAQLQDVDLCVWAIVDDVTQVEERVFHVFDTGQEITVANPGKHIGTFQRNSYVGHVFDGGPVNG